MMIDNPYLKEYRLNGNKDAKHKKRQKNNNRHQMNASQKL
jgi:hypothetical protein